MTRRRILTGLAVVALALAVGVVTPAGAQFVSAYLARTFTSNAPNGTNGFACKTTGCRVDLGPGASDYLYSDGTNLRTPSYFIATGGVGSDFVQTANAVGFTARGAVTAGQGSSVPANKLINANALNSGDAIVGFYSDAGTTQRAYVDRDGTYVSAAASGTKGLAFTTNGARLDLGTGANDYLYSDGTSVVASSALVTNAGFYTGNGLVVANTAVPITIAGNIAASGGNSTAALKVTNTTTLGTTDTVAIFYKDNGTTPVSYITGAGTYSVGGAWLDNGSMKLAPQGSLSTCSLALEGATIILAGSGATRTKVCVCTYTPTGAVAAWVNIAANNAGTGVGTTTTCP